VSTKIPFKGTSKEYVGEDVTEIFKSVKRALQGECLVPYCPLVWFHCISIRHAAVVVEYLRKYRRYLLV
jgi:hypothetical protein